RGRTPGVRLRDHGAPARDGLLRHGRGHRVRAARQGGAAGPRGRGEDAVGERAAAQGVLAQCAGTGVPGRVLEDVELPRRTACRAPRRRRVIMDIAKVTEKMIGDKRRWRAYKARVKQLPENYRSAVDAIERYLM